MGVLAPVPVLASAEELAALIAPGSMLALPKDESGPPVALVREIVRQGIRDLRLLCVPVSGLHADVLIAAGCVASVECGGIVIGEEGTGPAFRRAAEAGTIEVRDSTCPALHAALQAGAKGQPFAAVRGILGSDLVVARPDWKVIQNPMSDTPDPILVVPPLNPDSFAFHAALGDRHGNVWIGSRRELAYTAHASRQTVVTVENVFDGNLLADPQLAAGTLSAAYVSALAHVPQGAAPMALQHHYDEDRDQVRAYARAYRTEAGFAAWLHGRDAPGARA